MQVLVEGDENRHAEGILDPLVAKPVGRRGLVQHAERHVPREPPLPDRLQLGGVLLDRRVVVAVVHDVDLDGEIDGRGRRQGRPRRAFPREPRSGVRHDEADRVEPLEAGHVLVHGQVAAGRTHQEVRDDQLHVGLAPDHRRHGSAGRLHARPHVEVEKTTPTFCQSVDHDFT
ncbi:MAG: hypothetical protein ACHQ1G_00305 [Planctomycetota bacterium]